MRSIHEAVEHVVFRSPFLLEVIEEGVGNNSAIARKIKQDVEMYLYEKVSIPSISMALHRISASVQSPISPSQYIKNINDITLRSNLTEYVFSNNSGSDKLTAQLVDASKKTNDFFAYTRGIVESAVILQEGTNSTLQKRLEEIENIKKMAALSAITIRLPRETLDAPGVYYPILKIYALANISFVEIISIDTELTILFEDRDIEKAFSALKNVIS